MRAERRRAAEKSFQGLDLELLAGTSSGVLCSGRLCLLDLCI